MNLKIKESRKLKNVTDKIQSIILNSLLVVYIAVSLLSLENCTTRKDNASTAEKLVQNKTEIIKLLLNEFDAEVFDCTVKDIFRKAIVLDTTLLGISRKDGEVFLSAKVNNPCVDKYFVKLKCTNEILEQFNKTKTNNAVIAAKVYRIDNEKLVANADSLDGADPAINLGNTIILTGECLAIRELGNENYSD